MFKFKEPSLISIYLWKFSFPIDLICDGNCVKVVTNKDSVHPLHLLNYAVGSKGSHSHDYDDTISVEKKKMGIVSLEASQKHETVVISSSSFPFIYVVVAGSRNLRLLCIKSSDAPETHCVIL